MRKKKIIINKNEIKDTWEKYTKQQFDDNGTERLETNNKTGQDIMIEKVESTLTEIKDDKAVVLDKIEVEFLNLLDEEGVKWLTILHYKI